MKNKKQLLIYISVLIIIIVNQYSLSKDIEYSKMDKEILDLNTTIITMHQIQYETDDNLDIYWNFSSKKKEPVVKPIEKINNIISIEKIKNKNILCIEKSCYRLIGIYQQRNTLIISLYNSKLKIKLKTFNINDKLESTVLISNIQSNTIEFSDLNSTRKWYFKTFDVNQTKYKPKEIINVN